MKKTFRKEERLCSKKAIESLFDRKNTRNEGFLIYPIRVVYQKNEVELNTAPSLQTSVESPVSPQFPQVLFSVSKRNFKKAVDRNLIRRRMREAYRLNKSSFTSKSSNLSLAFVYVAKEICDFNVIERSMKRILAKC